MGGLFFVVIAVLVIFYCIGASSSSTPDPKDLPSSVEAKCPFCGAVNSSRAYIPSKEPAPAFFKCRDCLRYYGDKAKMTPEEKKMVEQSNRDCSRVDKMPEKAKVIEAVVADFKASGGFSSGDLGMVVIKDGRVEAERAKGAKRFILHIRTFPQ